MRLFIAFPLQDSFRSSLYQKISFLQKTMKATWVSPQNYHITIQFLGEVEPGMVQVIDNKLREIPSLAFSIVCKFTSVSYFPDPNRPKALIASIEHNISMDLIAKKVHDKMKEIDFPIKSPFIPHLTLARFKNNFGAGGLIPVIPISQFQEISQFALIHSILSSEGPTYQEIKTYSIKKGS
jgi:2'-5' RNA ligase